MDVQKQPGSIWKPDVRCCSQQLVTRQRIIAVAQKQKACLSSDMGQLGKKGKETSIIIQKLSIFQESEGEATQLL